MILFIMAGEALSAEECIQTPAASCDDQTRFRLIRQYSDVIETQAVWMGRFNLKALPLYIVHWNGKTADKGFLINPPQPVKGATPLSAEVSQRSKILRYDGGLKAAAKIPNQLFDMPFRIQNTDYFLMLYKDWNPSDFEAIPTDEWIRILVHEAFHMYQFKWVYPVYGEQDNTGYPFTKDILALSLLELKIVSAAFKTRDTSVHQSLLKMYTAARTEKMKIEPGGREFVKKMDNVQEYLEGSAKYFEIKVTEHRNPGFPHEHFIFEIDDVLKDGFQSRQEAKGYFTFGMWYFTGAIVLRMMENLGIPFVLEMENGATPYDIAQSHFKLSPRKLKHWLVSAKQQFQFDDLVKQAEGL